MSTVFRMQEMRKMFSRRVYNRSKPKTKKLVIKMSVNASGIRNIARVLEISPDTVMTVLKKRKKAYEY